MARRNTPSDGINRNDFWSVVTNNLPYAQTSNRDFFSVVSNGPMQAIGGRITETRNIEERFRTVSWSRYRTSYVFTINQAAITFEQAVFIIYAAVVNRFNDNSVGRIRFFYDSNLLNFDNSSRITSERFNRERLLDEGLELIRTALTYMLQSNEILDFSKLSIVLDIERNTGGAPVHSSFMDWSDDSNEEQRINFKRCDWDPKKDEPESIKNQQGLVRVPSYTQPSCGWMAFALYFAEHEILAKELCPESFFSDHLNSNQRSTSSLFQYLYESPARLNKHALLIRKHILGDNMSTTLAPIQFNADTDSKAIVVKYPQLQVVILHGQGDILTMHKGAQYIANESKVICLYYDRLASHFHYCSSYLKYVKRQNSNRYKACYDCMQVFTTPQFEKHDMCTDLQCDKCLHVFNSSEQYKDHFRHVENKSLTFNTFEDEVLDSLTCPACSVVCSGKHCLLLHAKLCADNLTICAKCRKTYAKSIRHQCKRTRAIRDKNQCIRCMYYIQNEAEHQCFIHPRKVKEDDDNASDIKNFWAFDFESMLIHKKEQRLSDDGELFDSDYYEHEVNFVCVQQCETGLSYSFNTLLEFLQWIEETFVIDETKAFFVAHNFKGYDGRLLFDEMRSRNGFNPDGARWQGSRIIELKWGNVLFRDSLMHIAQSLEQFPKIFGLDETQFAKGYFPYLFNVPENQTYVGPIPSIKYYDVDSMSSKKRQAFLKWYDEQKDYVYNFRFELEKYCISDVDILAKALSVYMNEGMDTNNGQNPMLKMTIASYAMDVYRKFHFEDQVLAQLTEYEAKFAKHALHGGRTDVRQMVKFYSDEDVARGTYAKYQDVQSLYPAVQFYKPLPVGHATVHYFGSDFNFDVDLSNPVQIHNIQPSLDNVRKWFGLVRCDITCSTYQHHPVIVNKDPDTGKLQADLNEKKNITLTTPELLAALDTGYVLTRVYEYHEYQQSTDLFKSYLRKFLKLKIQSSGMPSHCKTESDWNVFRQDTLDRLGIELEKDKMIPNAGKKQLAKLMLNSLWGKFAEARNYTQTKMIDNKEDYIKFEDDCEPWAGEPAKLRAVNTISFENSMMVVYRVNTEDFSNRRLKETNYPLACFVTAWGALTLWEEMYKLDKRVLYHDTDSIVYEHRVDEYNIPEGRYLGEWEDETAGQPIVSFVSSGPKTYAYGTLDKPIKFEEQHAGADYRLVGNNEISLVKYNCKCKGFTLNHFNASKINFQTMHKLIIGQVDYLTTKQLQFVWNLKAGMKTYHVEKLLGFTYNKGHLDRDTYTVYPYGYENFLNPQTYQEIPIRV